jgi:hypothetical protein
MKKLMIVQCGQQKIWKKNPGLGAVAAKDAYTSPYFQKNMGYAIRFGDRWMVLSAKYGFLNPEDKITDYNVTFKDKKTCPISFGQLMEQVRQKNLGQYDEIVVLGGKEYLDAVMAAFLGTACKIKSPFKGLSIGQRMAAVGKTLENDGEAATEPIIPSARLTPKHHPPTGGSGKYAPLERYLAASGKNTVELTFQEIEDILGFKLPDSAYKHSPWWSNGGHSQANAWLGAGYAVARHKLGVRVVFERRK